MSNIKIPIKNIYQILCYAWNIIDYKDNTVCGNEEFDSIYNLLGRILVNEVTKLCKRGFYKEYIDVQDELKTPKGNINITETVNKNLLAKKRLICEYSLYSEDVLFNQIIKVCIRQFSSYPKLDYEIKIKLIELNKSFSNVSDIKMDNRYFGLLRYSNNNMNYQMIMNVCKLFRYGLVANNDSEDIKFVDFIQESKMEEVFEKFILNWYKKNLSSDFIVSNPKIKFIIPDDEEKLDYLPDMQTDIVLYNKKTNKKMIMDAKFYYDTLVSKFTNSKKKIRNAHIYQINTYLDMDDFDGIQYGALIYPTTYVELDEKQTVKNRNIRFYTLNLNLTWNDIESRLMSFIKELI